MRRQIEFSNLSAVDSVARYQLSWFVRWSVDQELSRARTQLALLRQRHPELNTILELLAAADLPAREVSTSGLLALVTAAELKSLQGLWALAEAAGFAPDALIEVLDSGAGA